MYKILLFTTLFVLTISTSYSQDKGNGSFSKKYFDAENMVEYGDFQNAILIYKELLKEDENNANINFKIGYCYLNTVLEKSKAIRFFEKALTNITEEYEPEDYKGKAAPLETYYFLAQAYHMSYDFDEAMEILETLKARLPETEGEFSDNIALLNEKCENGKSLMQYPVKMNVTNLGGVINSEFDEHSPVFSADESVLIFTTKRDSNDSKINVKGQYDEDVFFSTNKGDGQWSNAKSISDLINTKGNDATIGLSVDGQILFIYRDDDGKGDIYMSKLNGEDWSKPEKLPAPINTKGRETSASLSADGNTLYFTSDRKGGYGGLDIYSVKKLPNGKWSEAQNMGPTINTKYNEESPFIHPDGVTLFFSSEGHYNMGGYDIFFTSMNEETFQWEDPTNLGYPINTTSDDVFYIPTPDGRRAYYASHQTGGIGGNDIYLISLPKSETKELTVMSGYVTMSDGTTPNNVTITVTDLETDEEVGVYTPNSKTGKYLFILKPGKTYNVLVEAEDFLYHSENIKVEEGTAYQKIKKAIKLDPIIFGKTKGIYYVTFDKDKSDINLEVNKELSNLSNLLKFNKNLSVEIVTEENSGNIGAERTKSLHDKLIKKGIAESRISTSHNEKLENEKIKLIVLSRDEEKITANPNSPDDDYDKYVAQADAAFKNKAYEQARELYNKALGERPNEQYPKDQIALIDNLIAQATNSNYVKLDGEVIISYVLFAFDKYETNEYNANLDKLVLYLKDNKDAIIEIHGHTDAQGSNEYNKILSENRANFVKNYLVRKGAAHGNLIIKAFGEDKQIAKDTNPQSRKYNRRVEFRLIKKGCCQQVKFENVKVPNNLKK